MAMFERLIEFWPHLAGAADVVISLAASCHALLYKRDTRAAIAWVGVIWLAPILGALLYVLFGINRIRRRAQSLRAYPFRPESSAEASACSPELLNQTLAPDRAYLNALVKLVGDLTQRPLLRGNRTSPLVNGDQAYPAMLQAIDEAGQSITLSTYIFDNDGAGQRFLDALKRAQSRGVQIRVLIDDVGSHYSWPSMVHCLSGAGIPVATFLPTLVPRRFIYSNMRNHRKLLVVDGRIGFAGGMNIREGHCLQCPSAHSVEDLHFRVEGPVVAHLQETFAVDWAFCTNELLRGEPWFRAIEPDGPVLARGISDGPDEDFDKFRLTILGAIACAQSSLFIVTPYFLPDAPLITSLSVAAMRGVDVTIVLPQQSNLALVKWASMALLWQVLEHGCHVWLSPPPFDHTKLMIVDEIWALLGSANWDPRSLRLNFESNIECYDRTLVESLTKLTRSKLERARPVTLAEVDGRALPVRLRDGVARLLSPYL